jgi:hypothetical protein
MEGLLAIDTLLRYVVDYPYKGYICHIDQKTHTRGFSID